MSIMPNRGGTRYTPARKLTTQAIILLVVIVLVILVVALWLSHTG